MTEIQEPDFETLVKLLQSEWSKHHYDNVREIAREIMHLANSEKSKVEKYEQSSTYGKSTT